MSNNLCPCSKLEWLPEHYHLQHHPDCQQIQALEIDAPPVGGFDSIPFGAIPFDGSPDHLYIRLTDGNGNHSPTYKVKVSPAQDDAEDLNSSPWIYPAQSNPSQHSIEFTHCGVKTFLTFNTPNFKANCSVCGEALFSRSGA